MILLQKFNIVTLPDNQNHVFSLMVGKTHKETVVNYDNNNTRHHHPNDQRFAMLSCFFND